MSNSSKGLNYRLFKQEFKLEPYLIKIPHNLRQSLFQLRTINNKLPVEKGRWPQSFLRLEQRKCPLCPLNDVGDELHYILTCPFFPNDRKRFIPRYYFTRPNVLKFSEHMSSGSQKILKNLALFSHAIIKVFNNNP